MSVRLAAASPADTETASTSATKKVSLVSLGCPKNLVDGEHSAARHADTSHVAINK